MNRNLPRAQDGSSPQGLSEVERRRRHRGWNAAELAAESGVSAAMISKVEHGLKPGKLVRDKLALALECSPSDLWPSGSDLDKREAELVKHLAALISDLWRELLDRLGEDFFKGAGEVTFEVTANREPVIHVGGVRYFRDRETGEVVAGVVEGAAVSFSRVTADGLEPITRAGIPGMN